MKKNHPGFQSLVRAGGGLLLLGMALTAWGITITLNDGTNSVICTTNGITTIDANGNIHTNVNSGATCDLSGSGDPPPPGGPFTLSVSTTGTGGGTVTSSPTGISCGGDCSEAYADGTPVSLTAAADSGSTFGGWSGACTGTGACNLTMSGPRSVIATFTADAPPPGACGAPPPGVIVVDTGNMTGSFAKQTYTPASPSTIYAFKVRMNAGYMGSGIANATKEVSSARTKRLVVSTCPGVLTPVNGQSACDIGGLNVAAVRLSGNQSAPSYYCKLPNSATTDYYVNAVSKENLSDSGFTCTNASNCAFSFDRSGGG